MRQHHEERLTSSVTRLAAEFLERHRGTSLITVSGAQIDNSGKSVTIFITVYPAEAEKQALTETRFLRSELRDFLDARLRGNSLTHVDFALDQRPLV